MSMFSTFMGLQEKAIVQHHHFKPTYDGGNQFTTCDTYK